MGYERTWAGSQECRPGISSLSMLHCSGRFRGMVLRGTQRIVGSCFGCGIGIGIGIDLPERLSMTLVRRLEIVVIA